MHKHFEMLERMRACEDGMSFVTGFESLKEAWPNFDRSDWMMWLIGKIGYSDRRKLVLIATRSIRETPTGEGKLVFDILPKDSVAPFLTIERYALGEDIAQSEIAAAIYAASGVTDPVYNDVYNDAYAAYTFYVAAHAVACAADADARAAYADAQKAQCDIIRSVISWAEVSELIDKKCKGWGVA